MRSAIGIGIKSAPLPATVNVGRDAPDRGLLAPQPPPIRGRLQRHGVTMVSVGDLSADALDLWFLERTGALIGRSLPILVC